MTFAHLNTCIQPALQFHTQDEPLYLPATASEAARIGYAHGYTRSLLHEVSHWCLAGADRLSQEDYGYWYEPDTRNLEAQLSFEAAEIRPQAFEWLCTLALGLQFCVSLDNLGEVRNHPLYDGGKSFKTEVYHQAKLFQSSYARAELLYTLEKSAPNALTPDHAAYAQTHLSDLKPLQRTIFPPRAYAWLRALLEGRSVHDLVVDLSQL